MARPPGQLRCHRDGIARMAARVARDLRAWCPRLERLCSEGLAECRNLREDERDGVFVPSALMAKSFEERR